MAGPNFNLLDTNAPARVGASFSQMNPVGAYEAGQTQALQQQGMRQNLQLGQQKIQQNQLAMQERQATAPQRYQAGQIANKASQMDNMIKMNTIRMNASNFIANAPEGQVLETALKQAEAVGQLTGAGPEGVQKSQQQLIQMHKEGGEDAIRNMAIGQSLDSKSKLQAQTQQGQQGIQRGQLALGNRKQDLAEKQFKHKIANPGASGSSAPSSLGKMINERQALVDSGKALDSPEIRAYDAKISGTEINTDTMTQDEIDTWGKHVALTGKVPSLGRGKSATKIRLEIIKSAARQSLGADGDGVNNEPGKTPSEAAFAMLGQQADTKSIQGSMNFLDKQVSAMGSFVENIGLQVDKVSELSKDLETFDSRILNLPLRAVRGKIKGSPLQAKYDMYLTEIEGEIGKLATGSSASIAELSTSAQEKWANIHDKNLSVKDMISLLQETKKAAGMRLQSVENQLGKTRERMVNREPAGMQAGKQAAPEGWTLMTDAAGNKAYVSPDGKEFQEVK